MLDNIIKDSKRDLEVYFNKIEEIEEFNSKKVLDAFIENSVCESDFNSATGYGYNDIGRDKIEDVFRDVLGAEDALVRNQFISGTHALTVALFSMLRPGDTMLSINGKPYDTLDRVIGIEENASSLKSYGVKYEQIDLIGDEFDTEKIVNRVGQGNVKLICMQRSRGYALRKSLSLESIKNIISKIREVNKEAIIMVDNCYGELVDTIEPTILGADLIVGSLIKNLGGGLAPNGAYIAGRKDLVELASERLTVPGQGKEIGPTLGINKQILQGLFFAPSVVASSVKTAIFASIMLEKLGYEVSPKYNEKRTDTERKTHMFYEMTIAGHKRQLPLFKVTDDLYIGAFIMFSDVEITVASAGELLKKAPEFDILVTAEAKSIPLIHEMARQAGVNDYVVARKGPKIYMDNIITTEVDSISNCAA